MSANHNIAEQETTPAVNLYAYAASAVPPKMDRHIHLAKGETPRGDFWIDTKLPRALLEIHQIHPLLISDRAQKYPIPTEEIPEPSLSALDSLALPGKNHSRGNPKTLTRFEGMARTMHDVGHWVDQVVLNTASAMLNLISPFDGWVAVPQRQGRIQATPMDPSTGEDTIECEVTVMRRQISGRNVFQTHLVVFSFLPWKVTPNDFRDFSKPLRFNPEFVGPQAEPFESTKLTRREKMWYFIHDICMMHECRWFVITSADYWCFGIFGAGWRGAYASPPLPFFNRYPTVLQVLILWTMSSLYENHPGNRFVMPLRVIDIMAAESVIGGDEDEILEGRNYEDLIGYLQEETPTEIDEREVAESMAVGAGSGLITGTLNTGAVVTRWGDEAHGEFSSINVVQDQPLPPPADQSSFRQAALVNSPSTARVSRRFSPYPPPSSQAQQESSRTPLSPVQESGGTCGNVAAGPSGRVDKGKGRAIDMAPADLKEALPTISNALARTVSAPASVLSLAFRTKPGRTHVVRTMEKWRGKPTLSAEGAVLNDGTTAGPSGSGRSSGNAAIDPIDLGTTAPAEPLRSGNSFLEHRSSLATVAPSSPVTSQSFIRQGDVIAEEDEDVVDAAD